MISIPPLVHFKNGISSSLTPLAIPKPLWRTIRLFVLFLFLFMLSLFWIRRLTQPFDGQHQQQQTKLIVITPTHKRTERLADLTRLSQTLMHVKDNLHWILVEDGDQRSAAVERLLRRSSIPHSYLVNRTEPGFPGRGWPQRNRALDFVRREYANFGGHAVIYFADDDNSYDLRLFRNFLPGVRTIGFWAVGLVRHGFIEAPRVKKSRIVGWETWNAPADVEFAIDMAGFGISLGLVRQHRAYFHKDCSREYPEDCFLRQFGFPAVDCQPFGFDSTPKEVLVWHTKTYSLGTNGSTFDYVIAE